MNNTDHYQAFASTQTAAEENTGIKNEWTPTAGWLEFDDSFIELLAGRLPKIKYYHVANSSQIQNC